MALDLDSTDLAETGLHAAHRGLPPSDRASGGRAPAVVARNLGISLVTLEKHYAAALQKGRAIALDNAARTTKTPRAVSAGASIKKRHRRDLNP
jgi:hypothetical protein